MVGSREWIRDKINQGKSPDWLRSKEAYSQFKAETDSTASYKTYKRTIHKVRVKHSDFNQDKHEEEPGNSFEESGNYGYARSLGDDRIKNIEDLIRVCKIDMSIWKVDNHKINKWEGYRSSRKVNMTFNHGVSNGTVEDDGNLHIEPMFKVEGWFSKKTFEPIHLKPVAPIRIEITNKTPAIYSDETPLKRAMILSDGQMAYSRDVKTGKYTPFHDRSVFSLSLQIATEAQPEIIIWNGDFFDLPDWSDKFVSSPDFYYTLQPALVELSWWMGRFINAVPGARHVYIEGNHCARMNKSIQRNMQVAYGLKRVNDLDGYDVMSIPHLMGFKEMGVEWKGSYPKGEVWLNENCRVGHGDVTRGKSGDTVKAVMNETTHGEIFGHIHRNEIVSKTIPTYNGEKIIVVGSFGSMTKIGQDGPPAKKGRNNWQQGFGFIDFDDIDYVSLLPIFVDHGKAAFEGGLYISEEEKCVEELREDTGWNF